MESHSHYASSVTTKTWKHKVIDTVSMVEMLKNPGDKKNTSRTPCIFFGRLQDGVRSKETVLSKSAIVLDADHAQIFFEDFTEMALDAWEHFMHTTYSSTPEAPRYRLIVPLAEDVTPTEYTYLADILMAYLSKGEPDLFDKTAREPSRLFFAPAANPEYRDSYSYVAHEGRLMKSSEIEALNMILDEPIERDLPKTSLVSNSVFESASEIIGVIGDFNTLYEDDLDQCIEDYDLPYTRVGDKWHFNGSKSEPGLLDLGDGYYYSHHATDPANGERLTAYDLVRIHVYDGAKTKFQKDIKKDKRIEELARERAKEKALDVFTPVEVTPSAPQSSPMPEVNGSSFFSVIPEYDPIEATVVEDEEPTFEQKQEKVRDNLKDFDQDSLLFKPTIYNIDVLKVYDPIISKIALNELTSDVVCAEPTPWGNKAGDPVETGDLSALTFYLERAYRMDITKSRVEDIVNEQSRINRYHPVREYLDGLEWDGIPRLETALPGVVADDYTRLVARKCLTAAVARVYEPGIKWDYVLVIQGSQGLGKTYWVEKMSKGFYSELGDITRADTVRELHQSWISVSDEAASISKGDFNLIKDFMTRTHDTYRLPYDKRSRSVARSSVIWATTNHMDFIPEFEEGTRRFLPVKATQKVDFKALTDDYIAQVWAEAKHLYQEGEILFLDDDQTAVAEGVREQYTANSGFGGMLEEFISAKVSKDWDELSPAQRIQWLAEQAQGIQVGEVRRTEISAVQFFTENSKKNHIDARPGEIEEIDRKLKACPYLKLISTTYQQPGYGTQPTYKIVEYPLDAREYKQQSVSSSAGNYFHN